MKNKTALYSVDLAGVSWQRASKTIDRPTDYNCVEVAQLGGGAVAVRDSNNRGLPPLRFDAGEWAAFVAGVKGGEFDSA